MGGLYAAINRCAAMSAWVISRRSSESSTGICVRSTKHWDEFSDTLTEDVIGDYGESLGEEHHFTDRRHWCSSCATRCLPT
jgi:hypothetical protein